MNVSTGPARPGRRKSAAFSCRWPTLGSKSRPVPEPGHPNQRLTITTLFKQRSEQLLNGQRTNLITGIIFGIGAVYNRAKYSEKCVPPLRHGKRAYRRYLVEKKWEEKLV